MFICIKLKCAHILHTRLISQTGEERTHQEHYTQLRGYSRIERNGKQKMWKGCPELDFAYLTNYNLHRRVSFFLPVGTECILILNNCSTISQTLTHVDFGKAELTKFAYLSPFELLYVPWIEITVDGLIICSLVSLTFSRGTLGPEDNTLKKRNPPPLVLLAFFHLTVLWLTMNELNLHIHGKSMRNRDVVELHLPGSTCPYLG